MNGRLAATITWLAVAGWLLVGCAGTPRTALGPGSGATYNTFDIDGLPQITLPGADRSDVKALAMGAARSKGWSIVSSSEGQLIVQRPLEPDSATARALGVDPMTMPAGTHLEVTSYFVDRSGGVVVATKTELVTPESGQAPPSRKDYTEVFRDSLDQSLVSLQDSWSQHHQRVANAAPPLPGKPESAEQDTNAPVAPSDPGEAVAAIPAPAEPPTAGATRTPALPPLPAPVSPPAQTQAPRTAQSAYVRPAPEPRRLPPSPAPVVDASPMMSSLPSSTALPRPSTPEDTGQANGMLELNPQPDVSWAAYAEQYARLRGCTVSTEGTTLIDTRSDGEIHKVPCEGADSFLVQCQNGVCRGLL